jgi:hypothetical protein
MTSTSGIYPHIDLNPTRVFDLSPNYLEAMANARFVRICGLAALIFSALTLLNVMALNVAVSVGIGMFMMWHDHENYLRALGIVAMIAASMFVPSFSPLIFSFAVFCRGQETLATLDEEKRSQEDWPLTYSRARVGTAASAIGLAINCLLVVWMLGVWLVVLLFAE